MSEQTGESGLPLTLERILAHAAADETFRRELLADRLAAVERQGYALNPSERAMLEAVSEAQLLSVLDSLPVGPVAIEPPTGIASQGIRPDPPPIQGIRPDVPPPAGIRPDVPPPRPEPQPPRPDEVTRGIRPDLPSLGIRPDSPIKGIRPGRLLVGAAITTAAIGAGGIYWCHMMAPTGSRPDLPAVTQPERPAGPTQRADAGPGSPDKGDPEP